MTSGLGPLNMAGSSEPATVRPAAQAFAVSPGTLPAETRSATATGQQDAVSANGLPVSGLPAPARQFHHNAVAVLGVALSGASASPQDAPASGLAALRVRARQVQQQLGEQPLPISNHSSKVIMKLFGG